MTKSGPSQFYELAEYYDAINDWKDYYSESERVEGIARRFGLGGRTAWLDVACGTGRHLEFLRRRHSVVGLDASRKMLRIARRRLPGVRLVPGDMRTFRFDERFDVVTCLFSAIGHLSTKEELRETFLNFARHLNPGGVAIVEPWIELSSFRAGMLHVRTHSSPMLTIVRLAYSARQGRHSKIHYHFLIGRPNRGIVHREVIDVGLLVSRKELLQGMRGAGLRPHFLADGLTPGRGLLVGIKSRAG
jgi:SAM-dependent methyltransferase